MGYLQHYTSGNSMKLAWISTVLPSPKPRDTSNGAYSFQAAGACYYMHMLFKCVWPHECAIGTHMPGKSSRSHHLAQKARWWKLPEKERRISWERCDVDVPSKNARASMASLMSRPSLAEAGSGISLKRESIPTQDHQDRHFIVFR